MRKKAVKVYISKELETHILNVGKKLGLSESEVLRFSFLEFMKEIGMLRESFEIIEKEGKLK
jgi:HD-GYP domain-containing protein (c-di-GMP phosphodiesterase class II)